MVNPENTCSHETKSLEETIAAFESRIEIEHDRLGESAFASFLGCLISGVGIIAGSSLATLSGAGLVAASGAYFYCCYRKMQQYKHSKAAYESLQKAGKNRGEELDGKIQNYP